MKLSPFHCLACVSVLGNKTEKHFHEGLEVELKYGLDFEGHKRLVQILKEEADFISEQRIVNHYYDTRKLRVYEADFRLRLRIINEEEAHITLKEVASLKKTFGDHQPKVRKEAELDIPIEEAREVIRGKKSILDFGDFPRKRLEARVAEKSFAKIERLGEIRVIRTKFRWHDAIIEIDDAVLGDEEFYEVEIELHGEDIEAIDREVRTYLESKKIPYTLSPMSKTKRFNAWYHKQQ